MSAKARSRIAVQWLPVVLFLGFVAVSALDTNATAASKIPVVANVAAGDAAAVPQLAARAAADRHRLARNTDAAGSRPRCRARHNASPARDHRAADFEHARAGAGPLLHHQRGDGEARRPRAGHAQGNIQLASVDPTATSDAESQATTRAMSRSGSSPSSRPTAWCGPSGARSPTTSAPQEPALMRCLADATACSPAAARFAAIVKEAREHEGRVRLNFVNQRVNNAIRYTSDMTQWGTPDEWSAPLAAGKGSFDTGLGDCEDYAIAKYVALRAAGIPAKQLRVLLVRDNIARLDHAVLAANEDGHWFMLDNRWTAAVEDNDVRRFTPLFALDDQGVKLLAAPYASRIEPRIEPMSEAVKGGKGDQAQQSSPGGITAIGLRGSVL